MLKCALSIGFSKTFKFHLKCWSYVKWTKNIWISMIYIYVPTGLRSPAKRWRLLDVSRPERIPEQRFGERVPVGRFDSNFPAFDGANGAAGSTDWSHDRRWKTGRRWLYQPNEITSSSELKLLSRGPFPSPDWLFGTLKICSNKSLDF